MPSTMKVHAPVAGAFDISSLERMQEHPSLAPLFSRRVRLNERLAALAIEAQSLRRQLGVLRVDGSFGTSVERRTLEDRLGELEREGGEVETALQQLAVEIERAQGPIRQQLDAWRTGASAIALQALVDALEALSAASALFEDCRKTNYGLLQSWILPQQLLDVSLPHRLQAARVCLEHLQQTVARLEA